ncbi:MAG: LysR family transcriptional regulator [Thalassotalea sp.]
MIERTHLAIIKQVDTVGTLTEAADNLCLTQSALSHSIKKLEQLLGVKVWAKEGRNLRLTQAGQALLSLANRILPQFEHTQQQMQYIAQGQKGSLKIGMECHPCYQWLLTVVSPYLTKWPSVDVDVKQQFQFGGIQALFSYDIDALVTPDPLFKKGLVFTPVFDYELVLVVPQDHPLAQQAYVEAHQLSDQILITYPVEASRLDIFSQFLLPAQVSPLQHKTIETTDIMLQMVASKRGVSALPAWLVAQYQEKLGLKALKLGKKGLYKQIFVGIRKPDEAIDYLNDFVEMAKGG